MSNGIDERGSELQRQIYQLTKELYPTYDIIYEYPIADLQQRIDIYIPILGIAIEIHGEQHYKFNSFFFADEFAWEKSKRLDSTKSIYLDSKGIKLVEIPYNTKIKNKKDLKQVIDSIPFPETEFQEINKVSDSKRNFLAKQRENRKNLYRKIKKNNEY